MRRPALTSQPVLVLAALRSLGRHLAAATWFSVRRWRTSPRCPLAEDDRFRLCLFLPDRQGVKAAEWNGQAPLTDASRPSRRCPLRRTGCDGLKAAERGVRTERCRTFDGSARHRAPVVRLWSVCGPLNPTDPRYEPRVTANIRWSRGDSDVVSDNGLLL